MSNRPLKFRVWDKMEKRFIFPDKGYQGHFFLDLNGRFHNLQNGSGGDDYVVQQYIGCLADCGRDIYEGDIVKVSFYKCGQQTCEVKWDAYGFGFYLFEDSDTPTIPTSIQDAVAGCSIIGNIFEKKNLLK